MLSRHDVVLAVIPVLALSGFLAGRAVHFAEATVGVGSQLDAVPFAVVGLVAAIAVIGRELFVVGVPAE